MKRDRKGRVWWWLFLVVVLAVLIGYFLISETDQGPEKPITTKKTSPVESKTPSQELPAHITEKEREAKSKIVVRIIEEKPTPGPAPVTTPGPTPAITPEEDYCTQIEANVTEFFRYLDQKQYVRRLKLKNDTYTRFKNILKRLKARLPVPAGEGTDPRIIIRNMYHFFRVLDGKDLRLIREVIKNEQDTMEMNLEMFYRWLMMGDRCPDPEGIRPSLDVLYHYAGFFMNSTGGRAYLFRRTPELRILVSYYCLSILYEADKKGKNNYGLDIYPFISSLLKEISLYTDFQFQSDYINNLNKMVNYYLENR